MVTTIRNSNNSANTFLPFSVFNTQSILDVFVLQNILTLEDTEKLKRSLKTNREIEEFLLRNRLVSRDTINKAYSILFKLPFIGLSNVEIPDSAMLIITKQLAKKYRIIPFGFKENVLRLALARPADLLTGYPSGLEKIFKLKGIEVELFITGESDFREAILQYSKKDNKLLMKHGVLPVINLKNYNIAEKYLKKIPKDYIEKYRLVVFNQNSSGDFMIACEQPDSTVTKKVLDYLEKYNNITLEAYATSKDDINFVLKEYEGKNKATEREKEKEIEIKQETKFSEKKKIEQSESKPSGFKIADFLQQLRPAEQKEDITVDYISNAIDHDVKSEEYNINLEKKNINNEEDVKGKPKEEIVISDIVDSKDGDLSSDILEEKDEGVTEIKDEFKEIKDLSQLLNKDIKTAKDLEEIIKEAYIPKIVAAVLSFALNRKVSDVHIEPQKKSLRVRFRIDGVLTDIARLPLKLHPPMTSRIKILSGLKIDEMRIPQDGRFEVMLLNKQIDVRVSSLPTVHGEKLVLRILDKDQKILSLEDLGMQGTAFDKTIEAISNPWGVILVTGPTGSGKSTTLNAILSRLNQPGVNIITLEDPVEYETPGINQCQVKPDIGFSFASGLRSVLRQDPNVIMVGEIRDAETAAMVVHSALTGHLVLSTLHTNDTSGTLPRLINMEIEPFLITSSINLVVAQRLVRLICPKCKEEMKLPAQVMEEIKKELDGIEDEADRKRIPQELKFFYGRGCSECTQGYKGRLGLFEVMTITKEIEELALDRRAANEIKTEAIKGGMLTMKQDGILKALAGLTTVDEVFRSTIDK